MARKEEKYIRVPEVWAEQLTVENKKLREALKLNLIEGKWLLNYLELKKQLPVLLAEFSAEVFRIVHENQLHTPTMEKSLKMATEFLKHREAKKK